MKCACPECAEPTDDEFYFIVSITNQQDAIFTGANGICGRTYFLAQLVVMMRFIEITNAMHEHNPDPNFRYTFEELITKAKQLKVVCDDLEKAYNQQHLN